VLGAPQSTCAESDDHGHYVIDDLLPGAYFVQALADGFLPASARDGQPIVLAAGELVTNVDISLDRGGARLIGHVIDVTGGPVPGAVIEATFGIPARSVSVTSGPDGSFALSAPRGLVAVDAVASGYTPAHASQVAPSTDLVLEMVPASTVRGVVATGDGQPVSGVEVRAIPLLGADSPTNPSAVSDSAGEFSIEAMETGEYGLKATGDGWLGQSEAPIKLGIAQSLSGVKVRVWHAAQVRGRVASARGDEPCKQGTVTIGQRGVAASPYDPPAVVSELSGPGPPVPQAIAPIAADGSVHFRGVVPGPYHVVVQCSDHVLVDGPSNIDVPQTGLDALSWKVAPGLGLIVHVVDDANQPLSGAPFRLTWPERGAGAPPIVMPLTTDAAGRYETPGVLFPGTYTLVPEAGFDGDSVRVPLQEGMGKVEVKLHIKGRGFIRVAVRTTDSSPVDAVQVSARKESDVSAGVQSAIPLGEGRFKIGPLSAGNYDVEVADALNAPSHARVVVATGEAQATIVLDRGASIRGRVMDDHAEPVPDVWVTADCRQPVAAAAQNSPSSLPSLFDDLKRVVTDVQGRFNIAGVSTAATCRLRAEEPHGSVSVETRVRPDDDVVLRLQASGALAGTAQMADGEPMDRFTLVLRHAESGQTRSELVVPHDAAWALSNVAPGKLQIAGFDERGNVAQLGVELAPGQRLDDVRLTFHSHVQQKH
jgi:hypothetical protein